MQPHELARVEPESPSFRAGRCQKHTGRFAKQHHDEPTDTVALTVVVDPWADHDRGIVRDFDELEMAPPMTDAELAEDARRSEPDLLEPGDYGWQRGFGPRQLG